MKTQLSVLELTTVFARLQGMQSSHDTIASSVSQLAEVARDLIPTAAGAGVSLLEDDGNKITSAATDRVVETLDDLQYDVEEGPCLSAWATSTVQRVEDTATDTAWPQFCRAARRLGVVSMVSTPLVVHHETIGALKVYATTARAFCAETEHTLGLLATTSAGLLDTGRAHETSREFGDTLQEALADQRSIDVATGVLLERHGLGQTGALARMLGIASAGGRTLPEIARAVLDETAESTQ